MGREEDEERPPITQQESSLGISQALRRPDNRVEKNSFRTSLRDDIVPEAGEDDNILKWARFYLSLYYNKLMIGMFGCVSGWSWYNRIDRHVILGALPTPSHIKTLKSRENITAVVNMCAEFPGYRSLYEEIGIRQIRLPTSDFNIPSFETIEAGIRLMKEIIDDGGRIYLHCKAGRGRSAVMALCYLMRTYKLNPSEAQEVLLECRPQADKDIFHVDEVRMYYKDLVALAESGKISRISYPVSDQCQTVAS